jgi:hypothetical protein
MTEMYSLIIFIAVCFVLYIVFRNYHYNPMLIEGMTDGSGNTTENKSKSSGNGTTVSNGMAGNAAEYAAALKANTINSLDTLMINKYRGDYESALINLDDTIDILMLKTALNFNQEKPSDTLEKLSKMHQAKIALNSVMKFVDSQ